MADLRIEPTVPVGGTVIYQDQRIKVACARKGCQGCMFETTEGAESCVHSKACLAHLRRNRVSVIFVNPFTKRRKEMDYGCTCL